MQVEGNYYEVAAPMGGGLLGSLLKNLLEGDEDE